MDDVTAKSPGTLSRRRSGRQRECHCCRGTFLFCWSCRCGFAICQNCMHANIWGLSCNAITWACPDCGGQNGFGNQ